MLRATSSFIQRNFPRTRPWLIWLNFKLRGRRISRDQWSGEGADASIQTYQNLMRWSWDEIRQNMPEFFRRLEPSVNQASGRVLEMGCGIGTMTRWIAARPQTKSVLGVDGFAFAIAKLKEAALPKVDVMLAQVNSLKLEPEQQFDTVYLCEFIEHLYADEEQMLLAAVRKHLAKGARFVVSVPIGWLEDPSHVRAFSKRGFIRHLRRYYGEPHGVNYDSGYSQVAWGTFRA